MIATAANLVTIAPDILISFFTKPSLDLLRVVQTYLGGGHLFDGFLSE
jgi:hypothetical protein